MSQPLFKSKSLVWTPGARQAFFEKADSPFTYLKRHFSGDWGELDTHDKRVNDIAVTGGYRILSAYTTKDSTRIWIITEDDRSVTTILLPSEY